MYNEEQKKRFIIESSVDEASYSYKFANTEFLENYYNKDCSIWTSDEILGYLKYLSSKSCDTLYNHVIALGNYTQWAIQNFLTMDYQNHYLEIDINAINMCVNNHLRDNGLFTRKELLMRINGLANPRDKFIILGLFEGIRGNHFAELINARLSDINPETLTMELYPEDINKSSRTIQISKELYNYAKESSETYELMSEINRGKLVDKTYPDEIIKRKPNSKIDTYHNMYKRIYLIASKIIDIAFEPGTSIISIWESGRIEMFKKVCTELGFEDMDEVCTHTMKWRTVEKTKAVWDQYAPVRSVKAWFLRYRDFILDKQEK